MNHKKMIVALLPFISLCACYKNQTSEEVLNEYDMTRDYADKQGYRGWYYFYGDSLTNLNLMTYHEQLCIFKGGDFWSKISPYEAVPGLNTESVIGFKVPKDAKLLVTFTIVRNPPDGFHSDQDGLWVYSYLNSPKEYLASEMVQDSYRNLHTIVFEVDAKKGDMLYVALNPLLLIDEFILLLGLRSQIVNGFFYTKKVKAFRVPAKTCVEIFSTSLHYAPCALNNNMFRVLIVLPKGTNTETLRSDKEKMLYMTNKWLLAHSESSEAKDGAYIGLKGKNIILD